ncbi:MAG TPA: hypothetical protein VHC72_08960 [Bryobacteraceae bacterium]|nr:hypothetical protein [Bryobacteraceae bacterium]
MDRLVSLLTDDVVLHSDGGGKALAVPNAVYGAGRVARGILGAERKLLPGDLVRRIAQINGAPGIISYRQRRPFSVITLEVAEGRIRSIYVVTNPEKLSHVPDLP